MTLDEFIIDKSKTFKDVSARDFAPPGKWADDVAKNKVGKKMKTTQLRKVFTSIKQMEQKVKGKNKTDKFEDPALYMLIPHLAYAKARDFIEDDFYKLMKNIIGDGDSGKIKTVEDFQRFVEFMTAIVAYHKEQHK